MSKTPYTPADHTVLIASVLQENKLPGSDCAAQLNAFADRLLFTNQTLNLTAITDPAAVALKHFADSLALMRYLPRTDCRLIDVGTGAGFPAIPLAICAPSLRVTAMDGTAKRIRFLQDCANQLPIPNLTGLVGRAEELGRDQALREQFEIATARAVADMSVLSELCLPFVRVGGCFLAMKSGSESVREECENAAERIRVLGGRIAHLHSYTLQAGGERIDRTVAVIEKIAPTPPAYPRAYAQIVKQSAKTGGKHASAQKG